MKSTMRKISTVLILGILIFGYISYKSIYTPTLVDEATIITINVKNGATVSDVAEKTGKSSTHH